MLGNYRAGVKGALVQLQAEVQWVQVLLRVQLENERYFFKIFKVSFKLQIKHLFLILQNVNEPNGQKNLPWPDSQDGVESEVESHELDISKLKKCRVITKDGEKNCIDISEDPDLDLNGEVAEFPEFFLKFIDDWYCQVSKFHSKYYINIREIKNGVFGRGASFEAKKINKLVQVVLMANEHIKKNRHLMV